MSNKLTLKEEIFCQEYFANKGNATAAYKKAYDAEKMKDTTIYVKASLLTKKDKIRVRLDELQAERNKKYELDDQKIIREMVKCAYFNHQDVLDKDGNVKPITEWEHEQAAAISSVKIKKTTLKTEVLAALAGIEDKEVGEEITTEIKYVSKEGCLDKLMRHRGLYEKDNRQREQTIFNIIRPERP